VTSTVPIADEELHAFIDGELPPDRAAVLQAALAAEPALAARVAAYRADKSALRALFGPVAERPLPAAWCTRIARHTAPGRPSRLRMGIAAGIVLALLGSGGALLLHGRDTVLAEAEAAHDGALPARRVIATGALAQGGADATLQATLGLPVRAPDLRKFGYRLVAVDVYRGPAAGLIYRNAQSVDLTIFVRKSAGDARFEMLRRGKLSVCIWQDEVVSAVMTGNMSAGEMMRVASAAYSSLDL
jgi:anti-sigma factor RsiW